MNAKSILLRLALVGSAVFCMAPGCNGDVLKDSTFRLWCGDSLCDWHLDAGHVRQTGTWHPDDYGVELLDTPTQISQTTTEGSNCMEFSAIADVEASSLARVEVDFNLDGVADFGAFIPETHWAKTRTLIQAPNHYGDNLRFIVRKDGGGRAVLAEIRLQRVTTCTGTPPEIHGVDIGEKCKSDTECASAACCAGICSACCSPGTNPCKAGQACAKPTFAGPPNPVTDALPELPMLCAPGQGEGGAGDPCVNANDCASQSCADALPQSACLSADGGACGVVRVRAGKCR